MSRPIARLTPMRASTGPRGIRSRRSTTTSAPISPNTAPDAPANGPAVPATTMAAAAPPSERDQVDGEEPGPAEHHLDVAADEPQREHVEREVDRPEVQETRGQDPPPLAVGEPRGHQRPFLERRRAVVRGDAAGLRHGPGEQRDVERDQHRDDERAAARLGPGDRDRPAHPPGALGDAVDALVADRRLPQALRAGGAVAPRAAQSGGAVGVTNAHRGGPGRRPARRWDGPAGELTTSLAHGSVSPRTRRAR